MDNNIYDVFKINHIPYSDITDKNYKKWLGKLIELIKNDEDLNRRLAMFYDRNLDFIEPPTSGRNVECISNLPDNLRSDLMALYLEISV